MLKINVDPAAADPFLRRGWKISLLLHFGLALACFLGIPSYLSSPPPAEVLPIGVELIETEETPEGPQQRGAPDGEALEPSLPETAPPAPESPPDPQPSVEPEQPTPTQPEPAPEPAQPSPVPPTPEPSPEAQPEDKPRDAPKKEEPKPEPQKPEPPPRPKKKSSQEKKKLDELVERESIQEDFLGVLKNVEKKKKAKPTRRSSGKVRKGVPHGALEGTLSSGEKDFIRQQIYPHWSIPAGVANAEDLIVELRISIQDDGTVKDVVILEEGRYRTNPLYRAAAESARRAVRIASPLKIPPGKVELLRSFRLRFNPKDALAL